MARSECFDASHRLYIKSLRIGYTSNRSARAFVDMNNNEDVAIPNEGDMTKDVDINDEEYAEDEDED
ncbi:hypothetical protein AMTR_s00053p00133050 [Amborella trichopoda]|uniref:Uncharacterized protein n=1 Tax=Amborella trichopoda TaxID=13333 RepID=W1PDE5_AMBTC|nr:hypothetical protein AMTR_s00053p00133050 [Amborella trichopoda]